MCCYDIQELEKISSEAPTWMFSSLSGMVPYCLLICSRMRLPRRWYQSWACWYTLSWRCCKSSTSVPSTWEREETSKTSWEEENQGLVVIFSVCINSLWFLWPWPWDPPGTQCQQCGIHLSDLFSAPWICCHPLCPHRSAHQAAAPEWGSPTCSHSQQT